MVPGTGFEPVLHFKWKGGLSLRFTVRPVRARPDIHVLYWRTVRHVRPMQTNPGRVGKSRDLFGTFAARGPPASPKVVGIEASTRVGSFTIVENVRILGCPTELDVGQHSRAMLFAVTEGDYKPPKYSVVFHSADLTVINKIDLLSHLNFDLDLFRASVAKGQPVCEDDRVERPSPAGDSSSGPIG